ncbi:MAG: hypothetical protein ACK4Q5_15255 [Saprospiraceae bacterium]
MPKTPSDKLFRLVKSLTPAEKRYFKIFIKNKTERESKYARLFDLVDAATEFDDEKLKTKIYKSQPADGKKYPELKAYLYDLVLKSLQSFDEQHTVEARLNHLLQGVAALFKRGLYDDCRELLQKAAKIARQYEVFGQQLEIVRWEKQLAYTRMDVDFLQKELERLNFEESRALEQLQNMAQYRQSFFQVYTTIRSEALHRGVDKMARLRAQVGQPIFNDPDAALSHRARVLYYRTLNLYHYASLEQEQFYETGKKLIELIESQPHFLRENLSDYIASLSNLILSCGLLRRYDEVRECLEKLQNLTPITEDDRRKIHRQYFTNKFALCIYTGDFEEGRQEMERHLREAGLMDAHETASFFFQYFCICFGCGDFGRALDFLNEWLRQPRTVERADLQSVARVLSLIIHYEMGNTMLLESVLRSTTRYLQKKNRLEALELRFVQFMSELVRTPAGRERAAVFQRAKDDLHQLSEQHEAKAVLDTFDLVAWVESKISGKTFAEAVRAKAGSHSSHR